MRFKFLMILDKHHKVSSLVKNHQNTQFCQIRSNMKMTNNSAKYKVLLNNTCIQSWTQETFHLVQTVLQKAITEHWLNKTDLYIFNIINMIFTFFTFLELWFQQNCSNIHHLFQHT